MFKWLVRNLKGECIFCGGKGGVMERVPNHGIYELKEGGGDYYHLGCVHDIVCSPKENDHRVVDMALSIGDRRAEYLARVKKREDIMLGRSKKLCDVIGNVNKEEEESCYLVGHLVN